MNAIATRAALPHYLVILDASLRQMAVLADDHHDKEVVDALRDLHSLVESNLLGQTPFKLKRSPDTIVNVNSRERVVDAQPPRKGNMQMIAQKIRLCGFSGVDELRLNALLDLAPLSEVSEGRSVRAL